MKESKIPGPEEGRPVILTGSRVRELYGVAMVLENLARGIREMLGPEPEDPQEGEPDTL